MAFGKLPASLEIAEIILTNYEGDFSLNILPQFVAMDIYMSIFSPTMRAEVLMTDSVGLLSHFPIVGEERIEIRFKNAVNSGMRKLKFRVIGVKDIIPTPDGRTVTYKLSLMTLDAEISLSKRICRAYNEPIYQIVRKIVESDLTEGKTLDTGGDSVQTKGAQYVVIPNMHPIEAIKWLTKRAVGQDPNHVNYVFFESFDGYEFKPVQLLTSLDPVAEYHYINHISNQTKDKEPYSIINLTNNKRFNTAEKLATGFYENEYFEIDPLNKQFNVTRTKLKPSPDRGKTMGTGQLNTADFITARQSTDSRDETSTRVRYTVQSADPSVAPTFFRDKFGEASQLMTAFSQISFTAQIQGNADLDVGDVISLRIPEMHGFNIVKADKYLDGNYLITDIKHQIAMDGTYTTVLNLNRDTYKSEIGETRYDKSAGYNAYNGPK
jgi:hypothetical protein